MVTSSGSNDIGGVNQSAENDFGDFKFWFEWLENTGGAFSGPGNLTDAGFNTSDGSIPAGTERYNAGGTDDLNALATDASVGTLGNNDASFLDTTSNFAIRVTTNLTINEAAEYTFNTRSDDGVAVYVDGAPIINYDSTGNIVNRSGDIFLGAGDHEIVIIFFHRNGNNTLEVSIQNEDDAGDYPALTDLQDANVRANAGDDVVDARGGDDIIDAGAGNDEIDGGGGNDTITGGTGVDTLTGGDGNDTIDGGDDNDTIDGGADADILSGGDGDDNINGGLGDDEIDGGLGNDIIDDLDGDNTIRGDDGNDTIQSGIGNDSIFGGADDDVITTDFGEDVIDAGAGNDQIFSNDDNDTVRAGDGDDTVFAGRGDDEVFGGAGNDTLSGDRDNDTIDGGEGDDALFGRTGDDTFIVSSGRDTIEDFNVGNTGPIDDGDQTNNDFVDLSGFFNQTTLDDVNNADGDPGNDFATELGMLRADAEDGRVDGIIRGTDFTTQIGDIDLGLLDGSGIQVTGEDITFDNTNVICFTSGTEIETGQGMVEIDHLRAGDLVETLDRGPQPIRWIGSRTLSEAELARAPHLRPIRIRAGALGMGTPSVDLIVSPQHRILVRSKIAIRMFDSAEVLIAAKHLLGAEGIEVIEAAKNVTYCHFIFDQHEVVRANGALAETLYPGPEALKSVTQEARQELFKIFPDMFRGDLPEKPIPARPFIQGRRARKLVERSEKNTVSLVGRA